MVFMRFWPGGTVRPMVAESEDVPGLVAEADSPNVLAQKLRTLIPELLELNGVPSDPMARFHVRVPTRR
jgi:hypothetical protein